LLDGQSGSGAAFAMRLVLRASEVTGAARLIDITGAHVDSCLYHGEATLDFVDRLVDGAAQVSVPTTLNVGALDLLHPELWRGDATTAERGRLLMERYRALGARPTFTCAPYQLADSRPVLGDHVAWGESNAIAFCNSVLGARTNRYGDFLDIAAAITGRVPEAGLHVTEARRATLVLRLGADVPVALRNADQLFPLLGIAVGRRAGSSVAVIDGLAPGQSEDRLKALGAAAASSGSVAMFHVVGSTPEAATLDEALQHQEAVAVDEIGLAELRAIRDELTTNVEDRLGAVPYLALYLLTGLVATFGHAIFHWDDAVPVLGASGAIAGVMGAYLVFRPRGRILTVLLWWVFYVPAWVLLGLFFVTQFLTPNEDSVAWIAHAAGMAAGFLAALVLARFFPDPWKPVEPSRPAPPVGLRS